MVTGAGSGVGKHLVKVLSGKGHKVLATDVNEVALNRALEEEEATEKWDKTNVHVLKLDVTVEADWRNAMEFCEKNFGGLDVCMNLAGYLKPGKTQNLTKKDIDNHVDVNLKGVMLGTTFAAWLMSKQVAEGKLDSGGHIINFASLGAIAPVSGVTLYIGTKYGCRGFSLCASKDLFDHGVFVTCVLPDAIQTPMVDLQLNYEDSALAFSGSVLSLHDVENVMFTRILPYREREVLIASSFLRGKAARLADLCSGSVALNWIEKHMRRLGVQRQQMKKQILKAEDQKKKKETLIEETYDRSQSPVLFRET